MDWTKESLWELRNEIMLGSLFISDYENSFEITPDSCCTFFDSYADYLGELMIEDGHDSDCFFDLASKYDIPDNLWNWYLCYEEDPFHYE